MPQLSVALRGRGPYFATVEDAFEAFGYRPADDITEAEVVVLVGDIYLLPLVGGKQRCIRILEPGQQVERSELALPITWVVSSTLQAQQLLQLAEDTGESLGLTVLRWEALGVPYRHVTRSPRRMPGGKKRIYCPGGSIKIPISHAEMVDYLEGADVLVRPVDLMQLLYAQSRGMPAFVERGTDLAEYVTDGVDGVHFESEDLNTLLAITLKSPSYLRSLTCAQPGMYVARKAAFIRQLEHLVTGRRLSVVFAHGSKSGITPWQKQRTNARGIRYQALVSFGARVEHVPDLERLPSVPHDFIMLGGRVPVERVAAIAAQTNKPIVMAMNDAIIGFEDRLEWFRGVTRYASLFFSGEPPELLPKPVHCKVYHLHQAPLNLVGPKHGTVRGVYLDPAPDPELGVVFLANHWYPRRLDFVERFMRTCPLTIIGNCPPFRAQWRIPVRERAYADAMQRAVAVLSTSICNDREITSCRLFEACSVGAYVIAETFPGCRDIYPDDCVAWFDTPEEGAALGRLAVRDPISPVIREMRRRAREHTWRHYSAHDRMETILSKVLEELEIR